MVNFGIGLGAFLGGVGQGMQTGQQIKDALDARKMNRAMKQASADASTARSTDIDKAITIGNGVSQADIDAAGADKSDPYAANKAAVLSGLATQNAGGDPNAPTYSVGGKAYSSIDQARSAAGKNVGSLMDYYTNVAVPKIVQSYLDNGQTDKAIQYQNFMDTQQAQTGMKHWATAAHAAARGDTQGFIKSMTAAYNTPGYADDGVQSLGGEEIKDAAGNTTGIRMRFKGDDGKEYSQDFNGMEDVYKAGISMLSPEKAFEQGMKQVDDADKAKIEDAKAKRTFADDLAKEKYKSSLTDNENDRQNQRQLGRDATQQGYKLQQDATENDYGIQRDNNKAQVDAAYRAPSTTADPIENARKAIQAISNTLAQTDLNFAKLPADQQAQRAAQIYQQQQAQARGIVSPGSPQTPAMLQAPQRGAIPPVY
jgi:hypothetical protein